jgi:hypothetical protein
MKPYRKVRAGFTVDNMKSPIDYEEHDHEKLIFRSVDPADFTRNSDTPTADTVDGVIKYIASFVLGALFVITLDVIWSMSI